MAADPSLIAGQEREFTRLVYTFLPPLVLALLGAGALLRYIGWHPASVYARVALWLAGVGRCFRREWLLRAVALSLTTLALLCAPALVIAWGITLSVQVSPWYACRRFRSPRAADRESHLAQAGGCSAAAVHAHGDLLLLWPLWLVARQVAH